MAEISASSGQSDIDSNKTSQANKADNNENNIEDSIKSQHHLIQIQADNKEVGKEI